MRKIELKPDGVGDFVIGEEYFSEGEIESIFGDLPLKGENSSYYIIPSCDVAEFEITKHSDALTIYGPRDYQDLSPESDEEIFGIELQTGETRRVTAIVHPPDEPAEEPVEANEPDWVTEPDGVGVWWLWDQKSPPVLCSVYDSVSRTGLMCRTFNGREQFTYQLSHEGHVFCRLEYVDLQQWYFNREAEPEPPPKPKCGWFEHKGERYTVCDTFEDGYNDQPYVVTPEVRTSEYGLSRWQSPRSLSMEGIQIHWYGDAQ